MIKPYKRTPKIFRLDNSKDKPGREIKLLRAIISELADYDLIVGHNIDKFDLDFIRSRAVVLGIPYKLMPLTYDTMKAFKRTRLRTPLNAFGKPSAGLDMTVDFFGLQQEKTKIYPRESWETIWGNVQERTAAMDKVVSHCDADVRMNERFYQALLPLDMKASIKRLI